MTERVKVMLEAIFCAAIMVLSAGMFYAGYRAGQAEHDINRLYDND